ncbi:DUF935 family protein [Hymenobacter sp. ASUV-10]|uniref:DUF935 family protein n=1 Tax=Hymenobacter aranciens TaxID=3063996 RepID=A0ABT9BGJ2_9BACT|nr:DUF935 family protein [Hymenobacter sp. ASUV-10]MDO7877366.1 DUF935 family protein [Hymenobacter sp. ASUV-10]
MGLIDTFKSITNAARAGFAANKRGGILSQSFPVQVRRIRQDVGKWRAALDKAEAVFYPDRGDLLNIYADVVLDAHLSSVLSTRKINVLGRPFKVVDAAGKENPKLTKLLQRPWFRQACELALDSKFWGHSLMEFGTPVDGEFHKVSLIDRQYVFPEAGLVRTMPGMINGTDYRNDPQYAPWVLEVGNLRDLGLLVKAAPYVIWKKNVLSAWADFTEMFGMPYRSVSGDMDAAQIQAAEKMMAEMGQAGYGIFSGTEMKIDFIAPSTGNDKIYDGFLARVNSELSKLVLGQTMTTDDGSSQSQANVHERVADAYTRDDSTWLVDWVNEELLPFLLVHGYPLAGYAFVFDESENLGIKDQWTIVAGILEKGYKVPASYLTERFGVPIEVEEAATEGADGTAKPEARPILGYHIEEGVVSRNEARAQLLLPAEDDSEATAQQKLKGQLSVMQAATAAGVPLAQALKLAGLEGVVELPPAPAPGKPLGTPAPSQPAATIAATMTAQLATLYARSCSRCGGHTAAVQASSKDDGKLTKLVNALIKATHERGDLFDGTIDQPLYSYLRNHLEDAVQLGFGAADKKLRGYLLANVQRFSGFKTAAVQRAMTEKLTDAGGNVRPFAEFREDALAINQQYNVDYLATEYNQAIASSQMAARWSEFGGGPLRYDTAGDDRVREEHQDLDGITRAQDDPFWDDHYPPLDWACRCSVTEVDDDATLSTDEQLAGLPEAANEFRENVGKTGRIFGDDHPYYQLSAEQARRIEEQL